MSTADLRVPERRVRSPIVDRLKRKRAARKRKEFVKLPAVWIDRLVGVGGKVYTVALHLLLLDFRNHGRPFPLPNDQLAAMGVKRKTKHDALIQLEHRGLIRVTRRPKRSPIVRLLRTV
jgi:hypothetical protein